MNKELKCCNRPTTSIGGFDDAQLTDHAYNLSQCDFCGVIYKDDLWEDKGLRAWLKNGNVVHIFTDEQWEESGLLKDLKREDREIMLDVFRRLELSERSKEDSMAFVAIRRVYGKIFEHEQRKSLLALVDLDVLWTELVELQTSGKAEVLAGDFYFDFDVEMHLVVELCNEYVAKLEAKLARKNKYKRP
jgi:hypothetical protein